MQQNIKLENQLVNYTIKKNPQARYLKIAVRPDCMLSITVPELMQEETVKSFIVEKKNWILRKIKLFQKFRAKNISPIKCGNYKDYKKKAFQLIKEKVEFFNSLYNFDYNKISIKRQKSLWGSCSANKNLNFNYKLYFLPKEMTDYVVVHELCHLQELNHSKKFWDLVAKTVPNYKEIRDKLRVQSILLA